MSDKKKRLYHLENKTVERIEQIEQQTGLKKSKIVDKAIEDYERKLNRSDGSDKSN